jgi:hypothetical protein
MARTIPTLRDELTAIANSGRVPADISAQIHQVVKELYRRPAVRRAPTVPHAKVPRETIKAYAAANPTATNQEIAVALGIRNQGRVSEALAGYR